MARKKFFWYQMNIYPTTQKGQFTLALVRKWGFHWHCEKHPMPKCKDCCDFGDSTLVAHWTTDPLDTTDLYEVLERMARAIQAEPVPRNGRPAYLKRLPTAR